MKRWICVMIGLLVAGCSGDEGSKLGDGQLTKSEARSMGGVDDDGEDLCASFDWYDDGICDDFCVEDDEDCDAANNDPDNNANNKENNDPDNNENNSSNNSTNNSSNNSTNNSSNNSTNNMSGADCGGLAGLTCDDDEWCNYPDDSICGAADQLGTCEPRPDVCTDDYTPVCGCDGATHSNECEAHAAGVDVAADGECESACTDDSDCSGDEVCVDGVCEPQSTQCSADSDCALGEQCINGVCVSDGMCGGFAGIQCPTGEFCNWERGDLCGAADALGTCEEIPQACPDIYQPVCGCDGMTYSNECDANAAGVSVAEDGECEKTCQANTDCPSGQQCVNGVCEDISMGQCGGIAGFQCAADEWCDYPDNSMCGAADMLGDCKLRPDACITLFDPVCGCDGQTHSNACMAHAAGVDVLSQGPCP